MSDALGKICQNLLTIAIQHPTINVVHFLSNGLRVHVMYRSPTIHLYISRGKTFPSEKEFETVLKRFTGAPTINPAKQEWGNRYWLYGSWEGKQN